MQVLIMPKISIQDASDLLGVHPDTLSYVGGGRQNCLVNVPVADIEDTTKLTLLNTTEREGKTVCYARVSTRPQKEDLQRQSLVLASYCEKHGWEYEIISDIGSGINYNKRGLTKLVKLLLTGEVKRLVVTHLDRLLRFGAELIFSKCEQLNVEVIIINHDINTSPEQELVQDVLEIITVFSARRYGLRCHQNKVLVEELDKSAKKISAFKRN